MKKTFTSDAQLVFLNDLVQTSLPMPPFFSAEKESGHDFLLLTVISKLSGNRSPPFCFIFWTPSCLPALWPSTVVHLPVCSWPLPHLQCSWSMQTIHHPLSPTSLSFSVMTPLATTFSCQRSSLLIRRPLGKGLFFWNGDRLLPWRACHSALWSCSSPFCWLWPPEWVFLMLQCPLSEASTTLLSASSSHCGISPTPLPYCDPSSGGCTMYPFEWVSVLWFEPMIFGSLSNAYFCVSKALSKHLSHSHVPLQF